MCEYLLEMYLPKCCYVSVGRLLNAELAVSFFFLKILEPPKHILPTQHIISEVLSDPT